ncbi:hypothetical protein [Sulfuriferula sp.]|uniref:hypothetical protein n=1 Tax=Sulfuriferula sp. TaxID=2025307 RepID=UPI00272FB2C1|nr:hypothetical protein [Sulfuriferula sp.]MDP2026421.1 hypothetical protein [Sulfuriferula sp.]
MSFECHPPVVVSLLITGRWKNATTANDWEKIALFLAGAIVVASTAEDPEQLTEYYDGLDDYTLLMHITNQHALDADIRTTTRHGSLEHLATIACQIDEYKLALDSNAQQQLASMAYHLHEMVEREAGDRAGEIYARSDAS